jgi:hypothetical protein
MGAKPRCFRIIVVDGQTLWWRFTAGAHHSELVIVPPGISGSRCLVRMPDWRDPWYHAEVNMIDGNPRLHFPIKNLPSTITPRFVESAIRWALAHGWQPLEPGPQCSVLFNQDFSLA